MTAQSLLGPTFATYGHCDEKIVWIRSVHNVPYGRPQCSTDLDRIWRAASGLLITYAGAKVGRHWAVRSTG